jgi:glycosyltransferase involved in cell wall biosynthesis
MAADSTGRQNRPVREPQVSVVIPTRNRRELLSRTLPTVLAQRDVELEVVVVDDGSTDDTRRWIEGLGDERVRVVPNPAGPGVAEARNAGIDAARAPWLAFLDDDDLWAPTKLADQLAAAEDLDAEWVLAGAIVLGPDLGVRGAQRVMARERFLRLLLGHNVVPGGASGVLAASEAVREVGGFDPGLRVMADWDLWIRLALRSLPAGLDRPLVGYVLHGANMTSAPTGFHDELDHIREKHAAAHAAHGVVPNDIGWSEWLSEVQRRSGLRLSPARVQARMAVKHRRPRAAARAVALVLWPGWLDRRDRWRIAHISPDWMDEAESWLQPIREGQAGSAAPQAVTG